MCTVTLIPFGDLANAGNSPQRLVARMACNRDESPSRPPALPPRVRAFGAERALLPIDPVSGGTWIAVTDSGLALCLLNVNRGEQAMPVLPSTGPQSRGRVIPRLLACATLDDIAHRVTRLDSRSFAPFQLVATDGVRYLEAAFDVRIEPPAVRALDRPAMFTSSGLGDELVRAPRAALFDSFVSTGNFTPRRQDDFHRHRWPDRAELSVCMRRPGAQTVSYTTIELRADRVVMDYVAPFPGAITQPLRRTLPLRLKVLA